MIEGAEFIELTAHADDRGYLVEIARRGGDEPHAVVHEFGQVYLVGDPARGTVRAFHRHAETWDWFFIGHGSAKFVLVDGREDSPTSGEVMVVVAGERKPRLIAVPPGVWHGWMSLEDDTQLVSVASRPYDRERPDEERIAPDSFGDIWTVKGR